MAGNLVLRLIAVSLALAIAFVAAGMFIAVGVYSGYLHELFASLEIGRVEQRSFSAIAVIVLGLLSSFQIAGAALAPSLLAIAAAELWRWQSLVANVLLGALVALASGWLGTGGAAISQGSALVLLATGFTGGFVYWLITGRNAGSWH